MIDYWNDAFCFDTSTITLNPPVLIMFSECIVVRMDVLRHEITVCLGNFPLFIVIKKHDWEWKISNELFTIHIRKEIFWGN